MNCFYILVCFGVSGIALNGVFCFAFYKQGYYKGYMVSIAYDRDER